MNMPSSPNVIDVLVVGAGPTGLTLAGELLRRGLRVRIIDKAPAPTVHSKAVGVHARTLEIFEDLGIAEDLLSRGIQVEGATMHQGSQTIMDIDFHDLDTRFPFVLCVSQVETESVLTMLLERRGGAVDRGHELTSFVERDDGIDAVIRSGTQEEQVRASWIVGCDGAHSAVRHALGVSFEGHAYEDSFVLADVHIDWDTPRTRVSTFLAEDGLVAAFPLKCAPDPERPSSHRWRIVLTGAAALGDAPTLDQVRALTEQRVGKQVPMRDASWIAPFRINCRQVESYRHGRAFLAGDAAHVHSPVGGQGMNTGIQDAHNLAWKLALVVRGEARASLLDSYSSERHAIGKGVLTQTDRATKMGLMKGLLVPLRNQAVRFATSFEYVRHQIVLNASELSVSYPKSPIVGEHRSSAFTARIGSAEAGETPTVGSTRAFAAGPGPGARAPDAALVSSDGRAMRLSQLWGGNGFTLFLFDGRSASEAGYEHLLAIAHRVRDRWGALVRTHVITRHERPGALPADVSVLHDSGELESRYGTQTECLYLVRPDLYIGFRSQPADADALDAHLASILLPA
jgi:2-polyprenyl-6-methoxyphenol hydroxylase-like FAD-dependent oxidoreductase